MFYRCSKKINVVSGKMWQKTSVCQESGADLLGAGVVRNPAPSQNKGEIMNIENGASVMLVVAVSALMYSLFWLITKGVIWVTFTLFHLNWYQDFWAVFVLMLIVGIFPISKTRK